MEQLLHALTAHGWKVALERMQTINLTNDFYTEPVDLEKMVREHVHTSN